jgi:NhaA family Na+:H+ antiporter
MARVTTVCREAWSARRSRVDDRPEARPHPDIRPPWSRSDRPIPRRVLRPLQEFLDTSTAGGTLLLGAAVLALAWANSPWGATYDRFWSTPAELHVGGWSIGEDVRGWVNDGLMTLFFLVAGLEIKRELITGELRDRRAAVLPALAAVGGMAVPAALFLVVTAGTASASGWGIPMATDIAFALGVLLLAARHAPAGLKPFVLSLAIVDDIGAIAVIAVFYSEGLDLLALAVAVGAGAAMLVSYRVGVRAVPITVALGALVWLATEASGVHPTIAGVALGLLAPSVPFQRPRAVSAEARRTADLTADAPEPPDADAVHWLRLASLSREAVSPLARTEHALLPWTSFAIVPLFALANAGVRLWGGGIADAIASPVTLGVVLGLVVGKLVGITAASWIALRTGVARLPSGVRFSHVFGAAAVAGIGFTVSLFVTDLAFDDPGTVAAAKVGILAASLLAGAVGWSVLRALPSAPDPGEAESA